MNVTGVPVATLVLPGTGVHAAAECSDFSAVPTQAVHLSYRDRSAVHNQGAVTRRVEANPQVIPKTDGAAVTGILWSYPSSVSTVKILDTNAAMQRQEMS